MIKDHLVFEYYEQWLRQRRMEPGHLLLLRSENPRARSPGVRSIVDDLFLFLVVALKTQAASAADCFTVKIKQIKRSDMVTFLFSVHTVTEAKQ